MRLRALAGLFGGLLLLLSSAAHAFLGWPAVRDQLVQARADRELLVTVAVGWLFGSVAMLTFGLVVTGSFVRVLRGARADPIPAAIVGAAYFLFGIGAFVYTEMSPHFLGFILIGALVLVGAFGVRQSVPGQMTSASGGAP